MIYIEELALEGFESHENTVIIPSKGLNVIVGETSKGKSSILRALKLVYMNHLKGQALESSINVNSDGFKITVKLSNGYIVIREKNRKTINRYVLISPDGKESKYAKFTDASVPLEIQRALGITKRYFEPKNEINFNFLDQIKSSFLVEDTGSKKSKVLGMIRETHYMDQAIRDVNKDIRTNETQLKDVRGRVEKVDQELEKYDYLLEMEKLLIDTEKLIKRAEAVYSEMDRVKGLWGDYRSAEGLVAETRAERVVVKDWFSGGTVSSVGAIDSSRSDVVQMVERLNEINEQLMAVDLFMDKSKAVAPSIKNFSGLSKKLGDLERVALLSDDYLSVNKRVEQYSSITEDLKELLTSGKDVGEITTKIRGLESVSELVDRSKDAERKIVSINNLIKESTETVNALAKEYGMVLEELGTCPVCRQHLDKSYVDGIVAGIELK